MIDLSKFSTVRQVTMPIINGWGQLGSRKLWLPKQEDGWVHLDLGDEATNIRSATPLEIAKTLAKRKATRVYALGREGIPYSFDQFHRIGEGETVRVHFMDLEPFQIAKVVRWDDGRFYCYEPEQRLARKVLKDVKEAFEKEESIMDIRGVTPELRYYYLLLNLQRQSYNEFLELERLKLSESERAKRVAEFQNSLAGRLESTINRAGGTLVQFLRQGAGYVVHWKVGDQTVKSTIRDDFRIISAGFCLSGDDRKHTMASIVQLARMFQRNYPLNITRE